MGKREEKEMEKRKPTANFSVMWCLGLKRRWKIRKLWNACPQTAGQNEFKLHTRENNFQSTSITKGMLFWLKFINLRSSDKSSQKSMLE